MNDAKRKKLPLKDLLCGKAAVKESLPSPLVRMLPVLNATSRLFCCAKYPQLGNPWQIELDIPRFLGFTITENACPVRRDALGGASNSSLGLKFLIWFATFCKLAMPSALLPASIGVAATDEIASTVVARRIGALTR